MAGFQIPNYGFTPFDPSLQGMGMNAGVMPMYAPPVLSDPGPLASGNVPMNLPKINIGAAGGGGPAGGWMGAAGLALDGLSTLGGLYLGLKQYGLAKKQFSYTKGVTDTNLANSIKSYNTQLEDRARSRGFVEGQSADQIQSYLDKNRAVDSRKGY